MTAREKLLDLCYKRLWYYRAEQAFRGSPAPEWRVEAGNDEGDTAGDGPTEEAACAAVLASLEPKDPTRALRHMLDGLASPSQAGVFARYVPYFWEWVGAGKPMPHAAPGWVRTSERVPEVGADVLAVYDWPHAVQRRYMGQRLWDASPWLGRGEAARMDPPHFWLSLPAAPEGRP